MGKRKPVGPPTITGQLREAITRSGLSCYALAKLSGVHASAIQRFMLETRSLKLESLDRIAAALGLRLTEGGETK
jgi:plasmid maintenance system antidote protein VapI